MSLFNTQPQYGYYNYGYQQPNPVQQLQSTVDQFGRDMNRAFNPNPTLGDQIGYAFDDLKRSVNRVINPSPYDQFSNSVNQFGQNLNTALYGEPEYSPGRLTSWGIGGVAAWGACANAMARSGGPGGFMVLAAIGVGAFFGNMAYDWYLRNVKYR